MHWYYAEQGRQIGPLEETGLDDLVRAGLVRDDTLVWHEGMNGWQSHALVRGRRPMEAIPVAVHPGETRYCGECGHIFNTSDLVTIGLAPICASCKPMFLQRIREGGQALGTLHFGGFWIRFAAVMIDGALLGVASFLLGIPFRLLFQPAAGTPFSATALNPAVLGLTALEGLLGLALACSYEVYFLASRGATIGKLALGLKVVRADGSAVPVGLAFGRYFAKWINAFTLYIGYIMAGFDEQKRALHDRICETRVIYSK